MCSEKDVNIQLEAPSGNRYLGRNVLLAYSTSRYRPSFERSENGLYATHLSKYLEDNAPVLQVFEKVSKCKYCLDFARL